VNAQPANTVLLLHMDASVAASVSSTEGAWVPPSATGAFTFDGADVIPTVGDRCLYSPAFAGDVTFSFRNNVETSDMQWGFFATDEDDKSKAGDSYLGSGPQKEKSWWFRPGFVGGYMPSPAPAWPFMYSTTEVARVDLGWDAAIKFTRVAGVFKIYVNDALVHTYTQEYSGEIRWAFNTGGGGGGKIVWEDVSWTPPTFFDSSGNGVDITSAGDVALTSTADAKMGAGALDLSSGGGGGSYLSAPKGDAWAFGTGEFYVGMWVYIDTANLDSSDSQNALISNRKGATNNCWCLYSNNNGQLRFDSGGHEIVNSGTNHIASETWQHVALQKASDGKVRIFLDGVKVGPGVGSVTMTQDMSDTVEPLHIGADQQSGFGNAWGGLIDEVVVVKGAGGPGTSDDGFTPGELAYGATARSWGPVGDNSAADAIFTVTASRRRRRRRRR